MKATFSGVLTLLALALAVSLPFALSQNPYYGSIPDSVPLVNVGGNIQVAWFARLDFAQMILEQQNHKPSQSQIHRQRALINSGAVSAFDLAAPSKAVDEFNQGSALLRGQRSTEAVAHLQQAIAVDPQFVSAHNLLGLAYLDADNPTRARIEFETAASLDARFAGSFLNLGRLALSQNDFAAASFNLEKASSILPADPAILTYLAYAQNGNHDYRQAIETADRVHSLQHNGMAVAHYIAGAAASSLRDYPRAESEFRLFLTEDPSHPLAATARQNIDIIKRKQNSSGQISSNQQPPTLAASNQPQSRSISKRLHAEVASVGEQDSVESCGSCTNPEAANETAVLAVHSRGASRYLADQWTIRKDVDEVDLIFTVANGGHDVGDLMLNDIVLRDDNKPPAKVLRFIPQSDLPLRVGVLIDTSGSVGPRLSFEKRAAEKFLKELFTNGSDLAFVAGFSNTPIVAQDFTGDRDQLVRGVEKLSSDGGTALLDAVSFACWKLAAYPGDENVAKVLVVFTDGEDNSGHTTLRQTIRDEEASGVIIYTVSTKDGIGDKTEADKVLQLLAERSGGEALFPGDLPTLSHSFDRLRNRIRNRYLIAYQPADFQPDGRYRPITIIAERDGKRLQVHARKGYQARAQVTP